MFRISARRTLVLCLSIPALFVGISWHGRLLFAGPPGQFANNPNRADAVIVQGREAITSGQYSKAANLFLEAADISKRAGETASRARALMLLSGCRIRMFDYRGAQRAAEDSRDLALKAKDETIAGGASIHLASIYMQVGDFPLASKAAAYAATLLKESTNKEYLAKALLLYAENSAEQRRLEAPSGQTRDLANEAAVIQHDYRLGIDVAHGAGLFHEEARIWEELGESLLLIHRPDEADEPLRRAYSIESKNHDAGALATNREHQAELQFQKQNYQLALELIDQAFASDSAEFKMTPQFYPLHLRAVLLENLNRKTEALKEYRRAADVASEWRLGALPGDATSTRTVVTLHDVYKDYALLAANLSLADHNPQLAREGLEALAENRAANLRQQIRSALARKQRLPQKYLNLLSQLQAAQARVTLGEDRPQDMAQLQEIRVEISQMENELGLGFKEISQIREKNPLRNSLRDIQGRLTQNQVLLSFSLGKKESYLWTVTEDQLNVYRLPKRDDIQVAARKFSEAIDARQNAAAAGLRLTQQLFSGVRPDILRKPEWLIVGDGVLLDGVPFSSLSDPTKPEAVSLTQSHNLRFLPSELLLLSTGLNGTQRRFVGVADPIYNMADSRRKAIKGQSSPDPKREAVALARLPGSEREIRNAAEHSGMSKSEILVGSQASISALQRAIATGPEILHFAVHVVNPNANSVGKRDQVSQAALALSLTSDNMPELLMPETIATLRLPGSLVVLDGCSSQSGENLPSAGLMGLSRAWLLAGAAAVVVSAWPTPDDSGQFFSSFYTNLNAVPAGTLAQRAALALAKAQVEMQHSHGNRSSPKFWAAYSVISKE